MIQKFKFDYDKENDNLFLYNPKYKSKASVELDDLIIDYTAKKEISAIELLHASNFFKDLFISPSTFTKETFANISECSIEIVPKNNFFIIKFMFILNSQEQIIAPILVPSINELSPAIST
jgi:uncharacterized protein YuzE